MMKKVLLFEQWQAVNEIGDASAKPFKWRPSTDVAKKMKALFRNVQKIGNKFLDQTFTYTFKNDEGVEYTVYFNGWMQYKSAINFTGGPIDPIQQYDSSFNMGYNLTSDYKKSIERETNMGEQFRIMSTVVEIAKDFMRNAEDSGYPVKTLIFTGKGDDGGEGGMDTRRGRMYMAFLQKQLKKLGTKSTYTAMPFTDLDGISGVTVELGNWHGRNTIAKSNESVNESKVDKAMEKIQALPQGKMFDDAKNIESVFKKSKRTWSEVIETFEKNQADAVEAQISIKDIQITQPNIQMNKVEKMLSAKDLPLINTVEFKDGYAIYDGHHRLMAAWALGETKIKVNLVAL